jgi:hypothetical protein
MSLLDAGRALTTCEHLPGFQGVLHRVQIPKEEASALAELRFAASLVRLGYRPVLDTQHAERKPDARVVVDGADVCMDVIAPRWSDEHRARQANIQALAEALLTWLNSSNQTGISLQMHILIPDHLGEKWDIQAFVRAVTAAWPLIPDRVYELPPVAHVRWNSQGHTQGVGIVPYTLESPVLACFGVCNETGNSVSVTCEVSDARLELMVKRKLKQFSPDTINLLVIEATEVPDGIDSWRLYARRRLQPTVNRRIGGILLCERDADDDGELLQRIALELHPDPYHPLPPSLVKNLARLDGMAVL